MGASRRRGDLGKGLGGDRLGLPRWSELRSCTHGLPAATWGANPWLHFDGTWLRLGKLGIVFAGFDPGKMHTKFPLDVYFSLASGRNTSLSTSRNWKLRIHGQPRALALLLTPGIFFFPASWHVSECHSIFVAGCDMVFRCVPLAQPSFMHPPAGGCEFNFEFTVIGGACSRLPCEVDSWKGEIRAPFSNLVLLALWSR